MIAGAIVPFTALFPQIDWGGLIDYDEASPLIFTRFFFWGFFAVVLAVYSVIYRQRAVRNAWLFAASLFFYWKTSGLFVGLLFFSITMDWAIGLASEARSKQVHKQLLLALSITINLSVLGFFKYGHFVVENVNALLGTAFTPVTDRKFAACSAVARTRNALRGR